MSDQSVQIPVGRERKYTTISIPTPLYQSVAETIEGTGFRSVTEFIVYITRQALEKGEGTGRVT